MSDQHDTNTQQIPAQTAEYPPLAYSEVPESTPSVTQPEPLASTEQQNGDKSAFSLNTVLLALVGVVLIAGLTVFCLALARNTKQDAERTQVQIQTTTVAPESSDASPNTAPVTAGPSCSGDYAAGTDVTSAEFASAVNDAYTAQATCGASATLHVWSPKTRKSYRMDCRSDDSRMICTGGSNAVVYIY